MAAQTPQSGQHSKHFVNVDKKGAFVRASSTCREWIKADGSTGFVPEEGRYHLYISYACPWACRALAVIKIKGIRGIGLSVVGSLFERTKPDDSSDTHTGWMFKTADEEAGCVPDPLGRRTVRQIYEETGVDTPRYTVPILFDLKNGVIVNNESSEIIQMLNSEFNAFAEYPDIDLAPAALQPAADAVNDWIYHDINNGVYKCGFAHSQEAYDEAVTKLFAALDKVEALLEKQRFLAGDQLTLADIRLFVTLVRFDAVYVTHFKCSKSTIRERPVLQQYLLDVYQTRGVSDTVNMDHIRHHYFRSHESVNPFRIVAAAPTGLNLDEPSTRAQDFPGTARFGAEQGETGIPAAA